MNTDIRRIPARHICDEQKAGIDWMGVAVVVGCALFAADLMWKIGIPMLHAII